MPVLSWLVLRGRCRTCGERISVRYPLVEAGTALGFGVVAWHLGFAWELPAYLYLVAVGIALALIDLDTRRLPDVLTIPSYAVALVLLLLPAVLDARWADYARAVLGGAVLFGFYFVLCFINPRGHGVR